MLHKNVMQLCIGPLQFKRFASQWLKLAQCYKVPPAKLPLVIEDPKSRKVRCGFILPSNDIANSSAFLSALVSDIYSPQQVWFNILKERYSTDSSMSSFLFKYGEQFKKHQLGDMTTFIIPSPFLRENNVEFLEIQSTKFQSHDGCHFYVNFQGANPDMFHVWPTVNITLSKRVYDLPIENEVNPQLALTAICNFIRDKNTTNQFLDAMKKSNFTKVQQKLEKKLQNTDAIISDLEISVLENILKTEKLFDQNNMFWSDKQQILARIQKWSEQAHGELQSEVLPQLRKFIKNQLSLWRVYTYSESKLQLTLLNTIRGPLCGLQMVNSLNRLGGELNIGDTLNKKIINVQEISEKATRLHKDINREIYDKFVFLQLPIVLFATFGVVSGECSAFSMGALASFGLILGFNRVLSFWKSMLDEYMKGIRETLRTNIDVQKVNLIKEYEESLASRKTEFKTKYDICHSLNASKNKK